MEYKYRNKSFINSIALSVTLITLALFIGIQSGLDSDVKVREEFLKRIGEIKPKAELIFANNFGVSLATLIPFAGAAFHLFVQYNTGLGIGILSDVQNVNPLLLIIFILPLFLLEYTSYTLALAEGANLSYLIIRRRDIKNRIKKHLWKTIVVIALLLGIGAIFEAYLINIFVT